MTTSVRSRTIASHWKTSRDWPLAGTALSAVLSFAMLFPPWLTSQSGSENAFGNEMQAAGPALIIVMALAIIIFVSLALVMNDRRCLIAASVPSSILLAIYLVKLADVSDLADLYNRLAAASLSVDLHVETGASVWIGFAFSLLTLLFLLLALGLKWGIGETLTYPTVVTTPEEPKHDDVPPTNTSNQPPPDAPPNPPRNGPASE